MASSKHELVEKNVGLLALFTVVAISFATLVELVPQFFQKEVTQPVSTLQPLSALAIVALVLGQLTLMQRFVASPVERALQLSAFGVPLLETPCA